MGNNDQDSTLRLLTYNIHYGANTVGVFNPEATADVIRNSGANVIALQEVDRGWGGRSNYLDEAEYFARKLQMNYVFGATLDRNPLVSNTGEFGIMILSKYSIAGKNFLLLPGDLEQRGVLLAWLKTPGGLVPVACTHLGLSVSDRTRQIAAILNWLPRQANCILMGDFNTEPYSPELAPLQSAFSDLQEKSGLGQVGTFFYNGAWQRIDYIFAAAKWSPTSCRVIEEHASDHLPVWVEIVTLPYFTVKYLGNRR